MMIKQMKESHARFCWCMGHMLCLILSRYWNRGAPFLQTINETGWGISIWDTRHGFIYIHIFYKTFSCRLIFSPRRNYLAHAIAIATVNVTIIFHERNSDRYPLSLPMNQKCSMPAWFCWVDSSAWQVAGSRYLLEQYCSNVVCRCWMTDMPLVLSEEFILMDRAIDGANDNHDIGIVVLFCGMGANVGVI